MSSSPNNDSAATAAPRNVASPVNGVAGGKLPRIVGCGHPLLDISCQVDHALLQKYRISLGSCNLAEPHQLSLFEDISQRREVEFVPGGASMNSIRVARWIIGENICSFVGSLGNDEFGCILERALRRGGVQSVFEYHEDHPTGTCACLIVEKERSLVAHLGAALQLSLAHMQSKAVTAVIERGTYYYLEGFFMNLVSSPHSLILLGEHAAANDKFFMLNLSAPYLCYIFKERLELILPYTDYLFGNNDDFSAYAASVGWEPPASQSDLLMKMVGLPKKNGRRGRTVVMTCGASATIVATPDGLVQQFRPFPVPVEEIVDTNGAGDAFVGGFLSQIVRGASLAECVRVGHLAAAHIIRHNGCTFDDAPLNTTNTTSSENGTGASAIPAAASK